MPIGKRAKCCDNICASMINTQNYDKIKEMLQKEDNFEEWNATSICNLSSIALNCQDKECRELALEKLEKYKLSINESYCTIV
jgi:hypothetical protein